MSTILTTQARITAVDQTLNEAEMAYAIEHVIGKARSSKTSVQKLSEKTILGIVSDAKAEANTSDIEGVDEPIADVIPIKTKVVKVPTSTPRPLTEVTTEVRVRGSHAGCTHDTGKVARAKCRRGRARAAAK